MPQVPHPTVARAGGATPRGGGATPRGPGPKSGDKPERRPAPGATPKPGKDKDKDKDKEEDGAVYRDRARERRLGVATADFAEVPNLPAATPSRGVFAALSTDADGALGGSSVRMDQYLGGDLEHTHLVKGLDYALLQKVRLEQQQKQQQQQQQRPDDASGAPAAEKATMAPPPAAVLAAPPALQAHTALGRAVLSFLQRDSQRPSATAQAARAARFARHATILSYNVDVRMRRPALPCHLSPFVLPLSLQTYASTDELPTTLFRSDAVSEPEADNMYNCSRDAAVLQAVVTALKDRRERRHGDVQAAPGVIIASAAGMGGRTEGAPQPQERPGRPTLPAAAAQPAAVAAPVDDDDDIFADAGREYVPAPKTDAPGAAKPPRGPVFGGNPVLPPPPAGVAEVVGADGDVAPRTEKSARLARMLAGEDEDDAYGELYPMGGQHMTYAGIGADSDDEGDGTKTKLGKKGKPGAGGKDEEEDGKPMDPKLRAQQAEKKLDTQLRGVQRALEEKHGDKHKTAFGAGRGRGAGDRGGAKREGEAEQPVAKDRAKRLRLD